MFTESLNTQRLRANRWLAIAATITTILFLMIATYAARAEQVSADVSITKTASSSTALPGDVITYTLVVEHSGAAAQTVTVSDEMHPGISLITTSVSTAASASAVTTISTAATSATDLEWSATMQPGAQATITFAGTLNAALVDGDDVESRAEAVAGLSVAESELATVTIDTAGPLKDSEIRSSRAFVQADGTVVFFVDVTNASTTPIVAGMLTVTVPSDLEINITQVTPNTSTTTDNIDTSNLTKTTSQITLDFIALGGADGELLQFEATVDSGVVDGDVIVVNMTMADGMGGQVNRSVTIEGGNVVTIGQTVYLPIIYSQYPVQPDEPVLSFDLDGGDFDLEWTAEDPISGSSTVTYIIEESTTSTFDAGTVTQVAETTATTYTVEDKGVGTFFYRVFTLETTTSGNKVVSFPSNIVEVNVGASGGVVSSAFTVSDDTVAVGECVDLKWNQSGISAISVVLAKGFDAIATQGQDDGGDMVVPVCPSVDTEYLLYVTESDGDEVIYSRPVDVTEDPPSGSDCEDPYIETYEADDYTVPSGETVNIMWDVRCASEVYFQRGEGDTNPLGVSGEDDINFGITGDTEFTLIVGSYNNYDSATTIDDVDRFKATLTVERE